MVTQRHLVARGTKRIELEFLGNGDGKGVYTVVARCGRGPNDDYAATLGKVCKGSDGIGGLHWFYRLHPQPEEQGLERRSQDKWPTMRDAGVALLDRERAYWATELNYQHHRARAMGLDPERI